MVTITKEDIEKADYNGIIKTFGLEIKLFDFSND